MDSNNSESEHTMLVVDVEIEVVILIVLLAAAGDATSCIRAVDEGRESISVALRGLDESFI